SWVVAVALAAIAFLVGFKGLSDTIDIPGLASSQVVEDLQRELPDFAGATGQVVLQREDGAAFSDEQQAAISELAAGATALPDVARVVDPFQTESERAQQLAELEDGRAQLSTGLAQLDAGQEQL